MDKSFWWGMVAGIWFNAMISLGWNFYRLWRFNKRKAREEYAKSIDES